MVDRRRIHRVIGRESDGVTRQQAEDFIAIARTDARRNRLELPDGRKTPLSFCEAAPKYIERLKEEDGKNIAAKYRQLKQHLVPFFGSAPLNQIASFDVERSPYTTVGWMRAAKGDLGRTLFLPKGSSHGHESDHRPRREIIAAFGPEQQST